MHSMHRFFSLVRSSDICSSSTVEWHEAKWHLYSSKGLPVAQKPGKELQNPRVSPCFVEFKINSTDLWCHILSHTKGLKATKLDISWPDLANLRGQMLTA